MNSDALVREEVLYERLDGCRFSWGATFAGAVVATAVTFLLLALGAGLGLSAFSATDATEGSVGRILTLGAIYFLAAQAMGFAVGAHVATQFVAPAVETPAQGHERLALHGLAVWALTVVVSVTMLAVSGLAAGSSAMNAAAIAGSSALVSNQPQRPVADTNRYWIDMLFRPAPQVPEPPAPAQLSSGPSGEAAPVMVTPLPAPRGPSAPADEQTRAEVGSILSAGVLANGGELSSADRDRIAQIVAERTGLAPANATERVNSVQRGIQTRAKQMAETARLVTNRVSLWIAASLLFGALVSIGAAILGRGDDRRLRNVVHSPGRD